MTDVTDRRNPDPDRDGDSGFGPDTPGTAVIRLGADREPPARLSRPRLFTPFIAQIAAIAAGAPQTRARRRAQPEAAADAYAAGSAAPPRRLRFLRDF